MAITYEWYVENQVILAQAPEALTAEDIANFSDEMLQLFTLPEIQQLHVIFDERQVKTFPKKMHEVVGNVPFFRHEKMGWFLTFGNNNPLVKFLSQLATSITNVRYRRVDHLEIAIIHLKAADISIDWEKVADA